MTMRIGIVSYHPSNDVRTWSGTPYHMAAGIAAAGATVVHAESLRRPFEAVYRRLANLGSSWGLSRSMYEREPYVAKMLAAQVDRWVVENGVEAIVAPGTLPVSHLTVPVPLVVWVDGTIGSMANYYDEFADISRRSLRHAVKAEKNAFMRAQFTAFASEWALDEARRCFGDDLGRALVIPFGANLTGEAPVVNRPGGRSSARLLLVGGDWYRKGAGLAVGVTTELRRRGVDAFLDIVGPRVPAGYEVPSFVRVHQRLDKSLARDRLALARLYEAADVFVLPTKAEAFGIVLAEASAHGLPSVVTRTGGTPTLVREGKTGLLVSPDATEDTWADAIQDLLTDDSKRASMGAAALEDYRSRLNWTTAGERLLAELTRGGAGYADT